jgi:fumarate hydratase, class I
LTVGPMGFGGKTSLIGCKIGAQNRLPASFFVSIAYDCWAFRRLGVVLDASSGAIQSWLYREGTTPSVPLLKPEEIAAGFPLSGREVRLTAPITDEQIRALHVGDVVLISGQMFTGRDAVHAYLTKHDAPVDLRGGVLYHCGPVVVKDPQPASAKPPASDGGWRVTAAGPTTSIREEPYQSGIITRFGVRIVIGKGGMGAKTLAALEESGAVYLNAIGGAAQFYARTIRKVTGVSLLEFGTPEAMWHLEVQDFPAIVTMDAHGNSLHKEIEDASGVQLEAAAGG